MAITDRYGLEVTTSSAVAAERFQDGMDKPLSYGAGALGYFEPVEGEMHRNRATAGMAAQQKPRGDR